MTILAFFTIPGLSEHHGVFGKPHRFHPHRREGQVPPDPVYGVNANNNSSRIRKLVYDFRSRLPQLKGGLRGMMKGAGTGLGLRHLVLAGSRMCFVYPFPHLPHYPTFL